MVLIKEIETKGISKNQLTEMGKVQKDMWAFGLGEYLKCNCCNKIHSKNDIFGHLSDEIRRESVTKLEGIYLGDSINCKTCNSTNTEFIYDVSTNVETFRDRYKEQAFLVLSYSESGDIVGFCDGYISDFKSIFLKDLSAHYENFSITEIEDKIKYTLNLKELDKMLYFSSLGTYEKYSNISYIYDILRYFFYSIKVDGEIPGITELDKNNGLYKIYNIIGSKSIGLDQNIISNTYSNYSSDICVFPWPIIKYFNNKYNIPLRQLLKKTK